MEYAYPFKSQCTLSCLSAFAFNFGLIVVEGLGPCGTLDRTSGKLMEALPEELRAALSHESLRALPGLDTDWCDTNDGLHFGGILRVNQAEGCQQTRGEFLGRSG